MIETNTQYEEYDNDSIRGSWDAVMWEVLWEHDIRPTIESLRTVARAAVSRGHKTGSCLMGIGLCKLCDALDAVPPWVLEVAADDVTWDSGPPPLDNAKWVLEENDDKETG